jgi:uncharacterized protein YjbI with pentapeptide repeats
MPDEAPSVIESPVQLRMAADDKELAGRTMRGLVAPGAFLAGADLDSVRMERVGFAEADLTNVRLEHAELRSVELVRAQMDGSLLHRVSAHDCDFTELSLAGAELRRCELGPHLRMARASFVGAKIQGTTFRAVELYGANFRNAVILRSHFVDYANATGSLTRAQFVEAVLIEVDLREVNLYAADLSRALLIRCDLRQANFDSAVLTGTRLIDCRHEGADLAGATV